MNLAICVICYNREDELIKLINCLTAIKTEKSIELIFSIDFSSNQTRINEIASSIQWPFGGCKIILHEKNLGLKKHVLSCGSLSDEYDGLILLEDDLIISPYIIDFVSTALTKSHCDDSVAGLSLYSYTKKESNKMPFTPYIDSYDSYFVQFPSSWGFVITNMQWKAFREWLNDWDCEHFEDNLLPNYICKWGSQSWKKHFVRYLVHSNKYFIYPRFSLTTNPGADGTHHNSIGSLYSVPLCMGHREWNIANSGESKVIYDVNFEPAKELEESFSEKFNDGYISFGTKNDHKKAAHIYNNYFLSMSEYIEFTAIFICKNVKKLILKLRFIK